MSLRKQNQEVQRIRHRLMVWMNRHPQGRAHIDSMRKQLTNDVAVALDAPCYVVDNVLAKEPFAIQISGFLYEEGFLKPWSMGTSRPIDDYINKHARRESSVGRRFLTALAQSSPRIWEVVDTDPGSSLSLRPLRETPNPKDKTRLVYDVLASENIAPYKYLFTRVLALPEGRIFSTSLLPIIDSDALALCKIPEQSIVQKTFILWAADVTQKYSNVAARLQQNAPQYSSSSSADIKQQPRPAEGDHNVNASAPKASESAQTASNTSDKSNQNSSSHQHNNQNSSEQRAQNQGHELPENREKLLERIRKLFSMAQETEASPYEAEIALRRCQKLMERYGIQESDLHTSKFSTSTFRSSVRVPMHIRWLASAVEDLHSVLFVTGGNEGPEFRGFEIDVAVAKLTMEYLEGAIERSLAARRRSGAFPAGRSAAYDYRVSFAIEVYRRVKALVAERKATEAAEVTTGTSLTVKKMEIVTRECGQDLVAGRARYQGARPGDAANAGRSDGAKVSLDPQVGTASRAALK